MVSGKRDVVYRICYYSAARKEPHKCSPAHNSTPPIGLLKVSWRSAMMH